MLDRDPNADQPPDACLSCPRPRPRSHKPKNAPKKQPQRGLGVAQLEKLRLEEQSKQQEAVCLASLQHQNLHRRHHSQLHQQEQPSPHLHHQHQLPFQQQLHSPTSSACLPRQIKLIESSSFVEPCFALPFVKLNVSNTQSSVATMASRLQTLPLPLLIPQQRSGNEEDTSMSPLSQVHDLCSPGVHKRTSSAESHLSPLLTRATPVTRGENSWLNHLYDRDSNKERDSTITFLSSGCCDETDTKMQGLDHGAAESAVTNLQGANGNLHISTGKLYMQNEGNATPFTDLCLRGRPVGAFNLHIPSGTHLEPPLVSIASGGVQTRELSSFQTISLGPQTWSPVDKVFNRKRSWECTQELARQTEVFKGVDLNTSVDEMESEVARREPNMSLPFTIRDDWNLSPGPSHEKLSSEHNFKVLLADKACSECGSTKVNKGSPDTCVNAASFLSLRKRSLDHEKWEVETSGEFLTLGPPRSSVQKAGNAHIATGNCSCCPVSRRLGENASSWWSQQILFEQAKGAHSYVVPRAASNDNVLTLVEELQQQNNLHTPLQRKVELSDLFAWNKVEACTGRSHLQESSSNQTLDLELRLSI